MLEHKALPKTEEGAAAAGVLFQIAAEDGFSLGWLPIAEQRGPEIQDELM